MLLCIMRIAALLLLCGENEPAHATKIKVSGHYIRGHVESVCSCLANDPSVEVSFPANAMIDNAGHKEDTFHQRYSPKHADYSEKARWMRICEGPGMLWWLVTWVGACSATFLGQVGGMGTYTCCGIP